MSAASWEEVERHARTLGAVEARGIGWLGLACQGARGDVRVRLERLTIAGVSHLGVVTGGCAAHRMSLGAVVEWNARLPPGCTVVLQDGRLWMRYLVAVARLTPERIAELVGFVAREATPLAVGDPVPVDAHMFEAFAD